MPKQDLEGIDSNLILHNYYLNNQMMKCLTIRLEKRVIPDIQPLMFERFMSIILLMLHHSGVSVVQEKS